jgi:hypothetical protein
MYNGDYTNYEFGRMLKELVVSYFDIGLFKLFPDGMRKITKGFSYDNRHRPPRFEPRIFRVEKVIDNRVYLYTTFHLPRIPVTCRKM